MEDGFQSQSALMYTKYTTWICGFKLNNGMCLDHNFLHNHIRVNGKIFILVSIIENATCLFSSTGCFGFS